MERYNRGRMPLAAHGVTHPGRRTTNEDAMLVDLRSGSVRGGRRYGWPQRRRSGLGLAVQTIGDFLADGTPAEPQRPRRSDEARQRSGPERRGREARLRRYGHHGCRGALVATLTRSYAHVWRQPRVSVAPGAPHAAHTGRFMGRGGDERYLGRCPRGCDQHPMRHVLTKVVGLRPELEPSVAECPFVAGDVLLLCSDGLHGAVSDANARDVAREPQSSRKRGGKRREGSAFARRDGQRDRCRDSSRLVAN